MSYGDIVLFYLENPSGNLIKRDGTFAQRCQTLVLSLRDIISLPKIYVRIYSKHKRWLVTPARMYSIVVLQESIHAKLSTMFVCPLMSCWNRTAAIALELASVLMMHGSSSSGWMRCVVCANLSRSAAKAFCISVDQYHFMPSRNSDSRGGRFSV